MGNLAGADRFVVVSGCSGGGKSTLIAELARRGFAVVGEPGRRIVEAEADPASPRLPWNDLAGFARAAIRLARDDLDRAARAAGPVFFDRGLVDALAALERATGLPAAAALRAPRRYNRLVFLAPPWRAIFARDASRRLGFEAAVEEHRHLLEFYPALGYRPVELPREDVGARADFVLARLGLG